MSSRRQLRRNLRRFVRYQARYLRLVTPSSRLAVTVRAASEAHYRALDRLSRNPNEAYLQWRRTDEGSHACRPFYVSMGCQCCGLPDLYRGQGDGIGSCDCPRCDCCGAGPGGCQCRRDWEDHFDEDDDGPAGYVDYSCNDPGCHHRQYRADRAEAAARG